MTDERKDALATLIIGVLLAVYGFWMSHYAFPYSLVANAVGGWYVGKGIFGVVAS